MMDWFRRVFRAGTRSFIGTLFLAIVFAPLMTLILVPRVGQAFAPFVCESGEMSYETIRRQQADGTSEETTYYCTTARENGRPSLI